MKAAVFDRPGPPSVLRYDEVPDPEVRKGGVLVAVEAIAIQGGDLLNRQVTQPDGPGHIVGYQASGVVSALGDGVEEFNVGDRVVLTTMAGSHAELVAVSARKCWHIPEGLSFEEASAVPIEFGTASDALFEFGGLEAGEWVLINGAAGGVGLAALQLASRAGARVIATAGDDQRLQRLTGFGAEHVVNYRTDNVPERVMELTDGHGADLVVDPIGGRTLEASIEALAYRGRISWIGNSQPEVADTWPLMLKNGRLTPQFFAMEQSRNPHRIRSLVSSLLDRVAAGELRVEIDRTFALSDVQQAHEHAEQAHPFGRVIMLAGTSSAQH